MMAVTSHSTLLGFTRYCVHGITTSGSRNSSIDPYGSRNAKDDAFISSTQSLFHVKTEEFVRAATLISLATEYVVIACGRSLYAVHLTDESKAYDEGTSRPAKFRKKEKTLGESNIFADLLSQRNKTNVDAASYPESELSKKRKAVSYTLEHKHKLHSFSSEILDIANQENTLVVLLSDEGIAHVVVCDFQHNKSDNVTVTCGHSFSMGMEASMFNCGASAQWIKSVYFVSLLEGDDAQEMDIVDASGQSTVYLSCKLFTALFGKEATCVRSPVLLLCDVTGHIYYHIVKSFKSGSERGNVLYNANDNIINIAAVTLDRSSLKQVVEVQNVISSLEAALGMSSKGLDEEKGGLVAQGLLIVNEAGDCCIFLVDEIIGEQILTFSLPHPVQSVLVKGNTVFFSTDTSVEMCELELCKQDDETLCVRPVPKNKVLNEFPLYLIDFIQERDHKCNVIIGVTDELELFYLPSITVESGRSPNVSTSHGSSLEREIQTSLSSAVRIKDVQKQIQYIDRVLQQVNILASHMKNYHTKLVENVSSPCNGLIKCDCSVLLVPNGYMHSCCLQVKLTNDTCVSLTDAWRVGVCLHKIYIHGKDSSPAGHFVFYVAGDLPSKSSIDFNIPLHDLAPESVVFSVSVSLIYEIDCSLMDFKDNFSLSNKYLSVELHRCHIDAIDCLQVVTISEIKVGQVGRFNQLVQSGEYHQGGTNHLVSLAMRNQSNKKGEKPLAAVKTNTFTISLEVPINTSKALNLVESADVLRLLLNKTCIESSQVYLRTPTGQSTISLSVCGEQSYNDHGFSKTRSDFMGYVVTLRSDNFELLVAVRNSVRSRLKPGKGQDSGNDKDKEHTALELRQKISRCERLVEDLQKIQSRIKSSNCDKSSTTDMTGDLCDLLDKTDLF